MKVSWPTRLSDDPGPSKALLVVDVEGTLFETPVRLPGVSIDSTIWQAIAQRLGKQAVMEEVETHQRWARGEYRTYIDWMQDTIRIHQRHGLDEATFLKIIAEAQYAAGAVEAMEGLDRSRYEPVLVSGGFRELARRAQVDFGIRHAFAACEYFFDAVGRVAGFNLLPCDFEGKYDFVRLMLREYKLGDDAWVFVGDGANDVDIASVAPVSIGVRPHPLLAEVATRRIESLAQLPELLQRL